MSRCRTYKCKAACCYNLALPVGFIDRFADKIVWPVIRREILPISDSVPERSELVYTSFAYDDNKCPFLRADYKCNVYENRPTICRLFGEKDHPLLKCQYRK